MFFGGWGICSQKKNNDGYEDCRYCERKFASHLLAEHEAIHMGKNLYVCDECTEPVQFFHEEAFHRHIKKRHEQTETKDTE